MYKTIFTNLIQINQARYTKTAENQKTPEVLNWHYLPVTKAKETWWYHQSQSQATNTAMDFLEETVSVACISHKGWHITKACSLKSQK